MDTYTIDRQVVITVHVMDQAILQRQLAIGNSSQEIKMYHKCNPNTCVFYKIYGNLYAKKKLG